MPLLERAAWHEVGRKRDLFLEGKPEKPSSPTPTLLSYNRLVTTCATHPKRQVEQGLTREEKGVTSPRPNAFLRTVLSGRCPVLPGEPTGRKPNGSYTTQLERRS